MKNFLVIVQQDDEEEASIYVVETQDEESARALAMIAGGVSEEDGYSASAFSFKTFPGIAIYVCDVELLGILM